VNSRAPLEARGVRRPALIERLLVAGAVAVVSALTLRVVIYQQAFLDLYFLPVAWASWRLGRRSGALTSLASAAIVFCTAFMDPELFAHPDVAGWTRWTNLGLWAGFLFLTSTAVAWLADRERRQAEHVRSVYIGVLEIMAKFIDSIDRSTDNHSRRVAERSVEVGRHLGLSDDEIETLRVGAYLHDIGKVEVSGEVLRKAARLTDEERHEIERHVEYGSAMVSRLGGLLEDVVPLVLYHHERWDGRGYKGLRGEDIPYGARILAVCDTYDAIVADRPYRDGAPHRHAVAILRAEIGAQFDPTVVTAFLELYDEDAVLRTPADARQAA
jgi:putative nucleotidyltransferase with HDIG domain